MTSKTTDLEIFNKASESLVAQKRKALDEFGTCQFFAVKQELADNVEFNITEAVKPFGLDLELIKELTEIVISKIAIEADPEKTLRCAVGWLIDPKVYENRFEDFSVSSEPILKAINSAYPNWKINSEQVVMLSTLQRIHDSYEVDDWEKLFNICRNESFNEDGSYKIDSEDIFYLAYDNEIYTCR